MAIQGIYYGTREALVAEVGAFDPVATGCCSAREGKYLVQPISDGAETFDSEWFPSLATARAAAKAAANACGAKPIHIA